jgi:hypothetical protein
MQLQLKMLLIIPNTNPLYLFMTIHKRTFYKRYIKICKQFTMSNNYYA